MRFSPMLLSSLIINPLRYFFSKYTAAQGLVWDADEKISTIEIDTVNNFNLIAIQAKPRILVSRGTFSYGKSGLTDNRTNGIDLYIQKGSDKRINTIWVNGVAEIIIEGTNEGTVEMIADMVSTFIVWASPLLCDTQGFHAIGIPMQVGECVPGKEDKEKFTSTISFPYSLEQQWKVEFDTLKFKSLFTTLAGSNLTINNPGNPGQVITT